MDVIIDVSHNTRFVDKYTALAVATNDKKYKRNVCLPQRVKRRVQSYSNNVNEIHCILIYHLIKDELDKYQSIKICNDISKIKINNNLNKLFKDNKLWKKLSSNKKIKVSSTKGDYVDKYVKKVREGKEDRHEELDINQLKEYLGIFKRK